MSGKVQVVNQSGVTSQVRCSLSADDVEDFSLVTLAPGATATLPLQVADTIPGLSAIARIRCWGFGNTASASNAKISITEVGSLDLDT